MLSFQEGLIQHHWFQQQDTQPISPAYQQIHGKAAWALWIFCSNTESTFQLTPEGNFICMFISQSGTQFSVISHLNCVFFSSVYFIPLHIVWSVLVHSNSPLLLSSLWISRVYSNKVSAICLQGKQHCYYIFPVYG